jgi:phospholipase C
MRKPAISCRSPEQERLDNPMPHPVHRFTRKRVAAATSAAALATSALTAGLFGFGAGPATAGEDHNGTATPI